MSGYENTIRNHLRGFDEWAQVIVSKYLEEAEKNGRKLLFIVSCPPGEKPASCLKFIAARAAKANGVEHFALEYAPEDREYFENAKLDGNSPELLHYFLNVNCLHMEPLFLTDKPYFKQNEPIIMTEEFIKAYELAMCQRLAAHDDHILVFTSNPVLPAIVSSPLLENYEILPVIADFIVEPIPDVFPMMQERQRAILENRQLIHAQSPYVEGYSGWQLLNFALGNHAGAVIAEKAFKENRTDLPPNGGNMRQGFSLN